MIKNGSQSSQKNVDQDANKHLDEFTVLQEVGETNLDHKAHDIDPVAGNEHDSIAANPLMATKNQETQGDPEKLSNTPEDKIIQNPNDDYAINTQDLDSKNTQLSTLEPLSTSSTLNENNNADVITPASQREFDKAEQSDNNVNIAIENLDQTDIHYDENLKNAKSTKIIAEDSATKNTSFDDNSDVDDVDNSGNNGVGPGNNNGHGNNIDGVDDDNPGQGQGGPNAGKDNNGDEDEGNLGNQGDDTPGANPNPEANDDNDNDNGNDNGNGNNSNNGHGNNIDGVDDDNPGQGQGGPNAGKDDNGDEDEGNLGNQGDDTPGANPNPNEAFFEFNTDEETNNSWLAETDTDNTENNTPNPDNTNAELSDDLGEPILIEADNDAQGADTYTDLV